MIYRFGAFELDARAMELRRDGAGVPVEPQVFALLLLLVENRDRLMMSMLDALGLRAKECLAGLLAEIGHRQAVVFSGWFDSELGLLFAIF